MVSVPTLFSGIVHFIERCPQCGVSQPLISLVLTPDRHYKDSHDSFWHFNGKCSKCKRHILFYGSTSKDSDGERLRVLECWPKLANAATELPERAKRFLQQALESKHAPDGAVMLVASAVDAMLKEKGYKSGSLFSRIEKAASDHLLTEQMRAWAHEIRLDANDPRHSDEEFNGFGEKDVERALDFAKALGEYLFVLPARVSRWQAGGMEN